MNDAQILPASVESEKRLRLSAQAALHLVSEQLKTAEEAAGALIYDWEIATRKVWRSAGLTRVLGWQTEEIAPTMEGWATIQHPVDKARLKSQEDPEFFQVDDHYVMEYRVRHKSGHYVWVLDSGRVLRDESGLILRHSGMIIDISARKKIVETLSRQTDMIELSFEPIIAWHPDQGIVNWNRGAEQLYGFTRAEAVGQSSHKLLRTVHPIDSAEFLEMLRSEKSWTGELVQRTKDGRQIFVESRHQAIETDGGILILETNRDITERKRTQMETARMAAVALASQDALFGVTVEGYIEAWNPAAERMFGYPAEEAIGQHMSVLAGPVGREQQQAHLMRACAGEAIVSYDARRLRKDGSFIDVAVSMGPVKATDGKVIGVSIAKHDISERRMFEARQKLMTRELAHRVKNSFAVLQAILRSTLNNSPNPQDFAANFSGRLQSLAAAQDILIANDWKGAELGALARHLLSPYLAGEDERLTISGPQINLPPEYAAPFGLIFNELATNALKYGGLSVRTGKIDLSWRTEGSADAGTKLIVTWREQGGPKILPPATRGFGSTLIEKSLADAKVERQFNEDGLVCTIELTLNHLGKIRRKPRSTKRKN